MQEIKLSQHNQCFNKHFKCKYFQQQYVFKDTITSKAASIVLVYNQPSDDPKPSPENLEIIKGLVKLGKILGIEVFNHILITQNGFLSFKQKAVYKFLFVLAKLILQSCSY